MDNTDVITSKLETIDKINDSLKEVTTMLYRESESNIDSDLAAFLIYVGEILDEKRLDLKNLNIDLIKDNMHSSKERSKLLCQAILERDSMEQAYHHQQLKSAKYLGSLDNSKSASIIR